MATVSKLRWGLLGCARICRRGLIPGIRDSRSGELSAIASRDLATAETWAGEFSIPHALGSYGELVTSPDVDAVYIPLPNELHKDWVFAAADAGKHVLCEKPLALSAREAEEMAAHCRSKGVLLMEAFMWRHQPRTAALLDLVRDGSIGTLRLIRSAFSFPIDPGDWRLDPARGGGALWDVGCYGVSTARLFAGCEPEAVRSFARFSERGVDLSLTAELRFPNGVLGLVDCSFEQAFRCEYELVGSKGRVLVPDAYLPPERPIALIRSAEPADPLAADQDRELSFEGGSQYAAMVDAFAAAVATGELSAPSEDGLSQMRVLDRVLTDAKAG